MIIETPDTKQAVKFLDNMAELGKLREPMMIKSGDSFINTSVETGRALLKNEIEDGDNRPRTLFF